VIVVFRRAWTLTSLAPTVHTSPQALLEFIPPKILQGSNGKVVGISLNYLQSPLSKTSSMCPNACHSYIHEGLQESDWKA